MDGGPPLLDLKRVHKTFGAVRALEEIDLSLQAGEVVGVMGDNGAGKSTLLKVLAGTFPPSGGEIWLGGEPVRFARPADAAARGIECVHQDLALCDNLTASANVFLGRELERRWLGLLPVLDESAMDRRAAEIFEELRTEIRPGDAVRTLSGGQRQAVAIARALVGRSRIILMDEPTASIGVRQVEEVLDLVRRLRDGGTTVLFVSHRMPDVFAVCERLVVLRRGRKVADKRVADSSPEEATGLITGAVESA